MLAICSRSPNDNDRVARLRRLSTNLPSAGLTAGSAGGDIDRPRVSGFLGASAFRIWSAVTSSAASAMPAAIDSAAPTATMAPRRRRLRDSRLQDSRLPDSFLIVLSSRARGALQTKIRYPAGAGGEVQLCCLPAPGANDPDRWSPESRPK